MAQVSSDRLIWERKFAREMFVDWRMWPSFIGAKVDPLKVSRGNMPVYVWEEQKVFMESPKKPESQIGKKRKRELSETPEESKELSGSSLSEEPKRRRQSWLSWTGLPTLFSAVEYAFSAITGIVYGENVATAPPPPEVAVLQPNSTVSESADASAVSEVTLSEVTLSEAIESFKQGFHCPSSSVVTDYTAAKNKVFADLQSREYFLGPADVYGGDYSIYKAKDPTNEHSVGTVRVVNSSEISVKELLTFSRVQNKVAKNAVLAFTTTTTTTSSSDAVVVGDGGNASAISETGTVGNVVDSCEVEYLVVNFKAVSERNV